jgi:transcription factor TFIIIB component B''
LADSGSKEWTPTAPPKKPRKPRKDKGQKRKAPDTQAEEVTEGNEANESGATEVERPAKKKRAPRRKKTTPANGANGEQVDGDGGGQDQTLRRRGRERETTPEDAEHHNVDPESTFLDSLASRNYRLGRMSEREKQMREVNWEEVKERRRKENALEIPRLKTREEKEAEAKAKEEAQHQAEQQRQRQVPNAVIVNGQIVVVAQENANGGGGDDGEGDIIEEGDVVEERDLTARITTNSFIRENKRFPREFMLAGQGKRWTAEMTERFYDALQIFGTDFNMIQTLFKDVTRRSIKLKFNREERENPAGIKAALNGQRKSNWEEFLRKGDYTEAHFKDPREMEAELAAMREEKREAIENVKARAAERRRQRKLAGLPEEEEEEGEDGEADKEGGKKKRKKRQAKTVQWQDEENVEIVGEVGDDEDQDL